MERERERGQNRNDLCSFVDGEKQNGRRGEGRQTEQGGLRKQWMRMIPRGEGEKERER